MWKISKIMKTCSIFKNLLYEKNWGFSFQFISGITTKSNFHSSFCDAILWPIKAQSCLALLTTTNIVICWQVVGCWGNFQFGQSIEKFFD